MKFPAPIDNLLQRILPVWVDRTVLAKATSFALIGFVNAAIDFGVFSLGHLYFGLPIVVANPIAWGIAVTNSYVLNSKFTFADESGGHLTFKRYLAFATTQVGGLIANTITVFVASYFMPVLLAKFLAIGASFVVDFTLSHLVVFRRRGETQPH
jgi:putative flippase GtrA